MEKKKVRLFVAYDGSNYCGWQVQPNGNTIEAELNKALTDLLGEEIIVIGASRTDAGVHSMGNVAVFTTAARMPAEKFCYALNQRLPKDIVVQKSDEVPLDWHPRYVQSKKSYQYRILNREFPLPLERKDSYFYYRALDLERMKQAANHLVGEHDFKSFCAANAQVETTVREIYSCDVRREGEIITITVTGSGFLYNMVRIIAGTLIEVGNGGMSPDEIPAVLEAKDRGAAGPTAPACGLTMLGIEYEE